MQELRSLVTFTGGDTVRFCGGEPTLHPELPAILDFVLAAHSSRPQPRRNERLVSGGR